MHPKRHQPEARRIVALFNKLQEHTRKAHELGEEMLEKFEDRRELGNVVNLRRFRTELTEYLGRCNISTASVDSDEKWAMFMKHFGSEVHGCPPLFKTDDQAISTHTGTITFDPGSTVILQWHRKADTDEFETMTQYHF